MEALVTKPNPTKIATKWALIYTLTAIVFTYIFQFMNLEQKSPIQYLVYIPFIAFLMLTQKEFKDSLGGYITFGTAFSAGFRYAIFVGLFLGVFMAIYLWILSPEVLDKSLEASRAEMEKREMSEAEIEKAMGIAKMIGPWAAAFVSAIIYAIAGAIVALIGASIFKKERSPFDIANDAVDPE